MTNATRLALADQSDPRTKVGQRHQAVHQRHAAKSAPRLATELCYRVAIEGDRDGHPGESWRGDQGETLGDAIG